MALIKQFQAFRANLAGYTDMEFPEFRARVLPLKAARAWSEAQQAYARQLASASAGYAIQQLCGAAHPAAAALLGDAPLKPEPMTRAVLETQLRALLLKAAAGAWPPGQYLTYLNYLNGYEPALPARGADPFADAYAASGPAFRQVVYERFTAAADRLDAEAQRLSAPARREQPQVSDDDDEAEGTVTSAN